MLLHCEWGTCPGIVLFQTCRHVAHAIVSCPCGEREIHTVQFVFPVFSAVILTYVGAVFWARLEPCSGPHCGLEVNEAV
eukprot:COSAG01_NODE_679_length_14296_cov_250.437575_7_plen_79_part_00